MDDGLAVEPGCAILTADLFLFSDANGESSVRYYHGAVFTGRVAMAAKTREDARLEMRVVDHCAHFAGASVGRRTEAVQNDRRRGVTACTRIR